METLSLIYNIDCVEGLATLEENTFDLILADPPYFGYQTSHRKDKQDKLSQAIVYQPQDEQVRTMHKCIKLLKQDRSFWFFTNWENTHWMYTPFKSLIRNQIIWDKGNWTAGDLKGSFGNTYEVILLGAKGKWEYSGRRECDIWSIPRVGTNRIHITEKPVALYKKIIENSTQPGDWILDPYLGSGASVIAALELGRNIIGYEIDKVYFSRIEERIANWKKISVTK